MKRVFLIINFALVSILALAQVPESFNYQAMPLRSNGSIYPNQNMQLRISILSGNITGNSVYTETFSTTTSSLGIINLQIGKGSVVSGTFININWGSNSFFIKIEMDPTGGTNYIDLGVTQLLSVPYSLYSKKAGNGFSGNYGDLTNKPSLFNGSWLNLTDKPTTVSGYGITDAFNGSWSKIIDKPTTVSGYGITDAFNGSWSNLTNIPTTISGYGITDASNIVKEISDEFNATSTQLSFTLSQTPAINSKIKMFINGVRISNLACTFIGNALTYIPAKNNNYILVAGDRIQVDYYY